MTSRPAHELGRNELVTLADTRPRGPFKWPSGPQFLRLPARARVRLLMPLVPGMRVRTGGRGRRPPCVPRDECYFGDVMLRRVAPFFLAAAALGWLAGCSGKGDPSTCPQPEP